MTRSQQQSTRFKADQVAEHPTWANCKQLHAGEPIPGKTYRADGWAYWDADQWYAVEVWVSLLLVLGRPEVDYFILTQFNRTDEAGDWICGYAIMTPDAFERLRDFERPKH